MDPNLLGREPFESDSPFNNILLNITFAVTGKVSYCTSLNTGGAIRISKKKNNIGEYIKFNKKNVNKLNKKTDAATQGAL